MYLCSCINWWSTKSSILTYVRVQYSHSDIEESKLNTLSSVICALFFIVIFNWIKVHLYTFAHVRYVFDPSLHHSVTRTSKNWEFHCSCRMILCHSIWFSVNLCHRFYCMWFICYSPCMQKLQTYIIRALALFLLRIIINVYHCLCCAHIKTTYTRKYYIAQWSFI